MNPQTPSDSLALPADVLAKLNTPAEQPEQPHPEQIPLPKTAEEMNAITQNYFMNGVLEGAGLMVVSPVGMPKELLHHRAAMIRTLLQGLQQSAQNGMSNPMSDGINRSLRELLQQYGAEIAKVRKLEDKVAGNG